MADVEAVAAVGVAAVGGFADFDVVGAGGGEGDAQAAVLAAEGGVVGGGEGEAGGVEESDRWVVEGLA